MPKLNLFDNAFGTEAAQGSIEIINAYVDSFNGQVALKTRPGLTNSYPLSANGRVDLYWWEAKKGLIATAGEKIFAKISKIGAWIDITPTNPLDIFPFNARVFFSADEYGVTMSAGQHMLWWGGNTSMTAVRITDSSAPTRITALTYLKGYTIASVLNSQKFQYATYAPLDDRTAPPPWSPLEQSASAQPDDIVVLDSGWEELFIIGRESTESHYVSGNEEIPLPILNGSVGEVGTVNNRTLKKLGSAWYFFTPDKQVVRMEGRNPRVLSKAIEYRLRNISAFDEAEALTLFNRFYVLTFPNSHETFVFDQDTNLWYEWLYWNPSTYEYLRFPGISAVVAKSWGQQIVGGFDGQVYTSEYTLLSDAGNPIRGQVTSGDIDHGTLDRKFASELEIRLRRGY